MAFCVMKLLRGDGQWRHFKLLEHLPQEGVSNKSQLLHHCLVHQITRAYLSST
jgi:hypothetical protein